LDVSQTHDPGAAPAPGTPRRKILVVDDEEPLRAIACEMLQYLGYDAEAASSGEEAVERVGNGSAPDLVVLDVIMPGMGGVEAFRLIHRARPDVKVLFATGFAEQGTMQELTAAGASGFIQKPYMLETLSERLKVLLA
jgi:CheY-like chemotaxis protein